MSRSAFLLSVVAFVFVGCDTTVQPDIASPPDSLAVYSVVQAFDSTQYAVVTRPRPADERTVQYVQDASVQIAGHRLPVIPEDSLDYWGGYRPLARPGVDHANYVTDSLDILPGETYRLRVARDEEAVTGTVHVPETFTGIVDSMTVQWEKSSRAQRYVVRVRRYDEHDAGDLEWEFTTSTTDTTVTIPNTVSEYSGAFQPGPHDVIITAVDSNFVGYNDADVRRSGIEGGFGFFGAITRIGGAVDLPATEDEKQIENSPSLRPRPDQPPIFIDGLLDRF